MNTLEYLMLTREDKNNRVTNYNYDGIFIYGDENYGLVRFWYADGNLCRDCWLKNGILHGECKLWSATGILIIHLLYENGELIKDYLKEN